MEALGYDLNRADADPIEKDTLFFTKKNGINARGIYNKDTGAFTVLAGSEVDLSRPILKNQVADNTRKRLFGSSTNIAVLESDITFSAPSRAAVFILGGSQNGWLEWTNQHHQTLDEAYRSKE
jgi:hypothetical protein